MTELQPPPTTPRLARSTLILAFLGALTFLYLRTFLLPATPFTGISDQILFFSRAARTLHGQILYRDVFELVPPGTEILYATALRLFGMHAWLIQAFAIAFGLAFAWLITRIASRILSGYLILLPALLFLVFDYNSALDLTHHWYSTLIAMAAVSVLMEGTTIPRTCAAGSLSAFATLFTQTQGAFTLFALILYLLWLKRSGAISNIGKHLVALILPFTLILFSILGFYVYKAGFQIVFFDLVLFSLKYLANMRSYLSELPRSLTAAGIIRLVPYLFIFAINPYIYLVGLYKLWRMRNNLSPILRQRLVLLNLVGLALFISIAISGAGFFRICTVSPPAILICVWLLSPRNPVLVITRNLLYVLGIAYALLIPIYRQTRWYAILNLPTGRTAFTDPLLYNEFRWFAQRTHPSDLFFNDAAVGPLSLTR